MIGEELDLREVLERLLKDKPSSITLSGGVLVVEVDEHISDETIAAGRVRTVVIVRKAIERPRAAQKRET
jgi:hypothetical protein